jgi:glycosyltransferase involved in cell wall biosynthesis
VRWVADFRDPWIDMLPHWFADTRSTLSDRIERWMERQVVRRADKVVTTTERMRAAMRARYPKLPPDRFLTIPNSIDSDRLCTLAATPAAKYPQFTITYAGALYFGRTPEPLFLAVSDLVRAGRIAESELRIKLVGRCHEVDGTPTAEVASRYGLTAVVEILDAVPYDEVIPILQKSHLLLVLAPDGHQLVVPAKVFDYLGAGSRILALAEPGATADVISETGSGRSFPYADVAGMREYLYALMRQPGGRESTVSPAALARYDARQLTGRLASEALDHFVPAGCPRTVQA